MNSQTDKPAPLVNYGGQAVLEGVMMRGRSHMAVSVRRPDGTIRTEIRPLSALYQSTLARIPFLRSLLLLWDTLGLGMQSLAFSAQEQGEEPITKKEWASSIGLSLLIFVGIFVLLPSALAQWLETAAGISALTGNILEGVVRLVFLIGYLVAIGKIPEIERVFAYHGAEHKTINAFEAGAELTPESVEQFSESHPRCGTSFLVVLGMLAILLFALMGPLSFGLRIVSRILALPVLVMFGYEFLRLTARFAGSWAGRVLAAPGMWAQRLTTRKPDRSMLEVSISAFRAMRDAEAGIAAPAPPEPAG